MNQSPWRIEPYDAGHLEAIVELSLRAWAPVFVELEKMLDAAVYQAFYPEGWQASQSKDVRAVCTSAEARVWVANNGRTVGGFVAVKHQGGETLGERSI